MAKNFSINMEDGVLVSVEIDGVVYTDPEEIPDPEDRARVQALIADPDSGDNFNEEDDFDAHFKEDFEKEFQEAQLQAAKFPTLFFSIFLAVALILLGIAAFLTYQSFRTLQKETAVPGQVVNLVERSSYNNQSGVTNVYSYPVVEFKDLTGEHQRVELNEGSWPPAYKTGDAVTILYNPEQPRNARIKSASSAILLWLAPAITGTIGLVFLAVALIVVGVHRSQFKKQNQGAMQNQTAIKWD